MKIAIVAAAAVASLSLAACNQRDEALPQGSAVGAAMPDTEAPRNPDMRMTAPDAGQTGVVPADGSAPAVAETPAVGTAGGATGIIGPTTDQVPPKK